MDIDIMISRYRDNDLRLEDNFFLFQGPRGFLGPRGAPGPSGPPVSGLDSFPRHPNCPFK